MQYIKEGRKGKRTDGQSGNSSEHIKTTHIANISLGLCFLFIIGTPLQGAIQNSVFITFFKRNLLLGLQIDKNAKTKSSSQTEQSIVHLVPCFSCLNM